MSDLDELLDGFDGQGAGDDEDGFEGQGAGNDEDEEPVGLGEENENSNVGST